MADADSETRSLSPSYRETVYEHDRLYQKISYERQLYCVPIDEEEERRLEIQHQIIGRLFGRNPFLNHVESPQRVLDCGYGQAQWILEVAQEYEDCKVDAVDIYPLELPDEPENLNRYCDDLNEHLNGFFERGTYDIVQSRFVSPGIHKNRWRSYIEELVGLLQPGGTLQMIEYYYNIQSHSGLIGDESALYQWGRKYREATSTDRDPRIGSSDPRRGGKTRLQLLMEETGLVEVQHRNEDVPIGDWPEDQGRKSIGAMNLQNVDKMLDSLGTWAFVQRLGMSLNEVRHLNDRARQELRNPRLRAYIPLCACRLGNAWVDGADKRQDRSLGKTCGEPK